MALFIIRKEVHLSHADVRNLRIINKTPPSGKPFEFKPIKLPFVLRIDEGDVDHLEIKLATSDVSFHDVHLQDALWSETKLEFENLVWIWAIFQSITQQVKWISVVNIH